MPTLLLHGERDRSVTAGHAELLLRELPHAHLTRYQRAHHMLVLERADRLAHDVDDFARGLPRTGPARRPPGDRRWAANPGARPGHAVGGIDRRGATDASTFSSGWRSGNLSDGEDVEEA